MFTINKIEKKPRQTGNPARLTAALSAILLSLLPVQEAWAKCEVVQEARQVNFGNVDLLNPQPITTQMQVTVTCSKIVPTWNPQKFNVCLTADGGRGISQFLSPRRMCQNGSCGSGILTYNLYGDPNHTDILTSTSQHVGKSINKVIQVDSIFSPQSITFPIYAKLTPNQTNVVPGNYTASFAGGSTAMAFYSTDEDTPKACASNLFGNLRFEFDVSATVIKKCNITAPQNIDFGTVGSLTTNLQGQTSLGVTCTRDTPYKIGLMPSNRNVNGAGEMAAKKAGNTDRVPYQLRSQAGMNGKIWGNTATSQAVGNGVGGTGTGMQQKHNIYATVDSADYRTGNYQDKVIINVHY